MEQLQKADSVRFCDRSDLLCVKFVIIGMGNTVF